MKSKPLVLLALAMGCGLVAMLGVQQILSGGAGSASTTKVLVAKQEINPGVELTAAVAEFQDWPNSTVPPGAVTEAIEYEKRALKVRAFPGEVILQAKLGERGAFGASAAIATGMRVVSVPVNNTSAISGMIRPSDRVDILVTYKTQRPGAEQKTSTKTVLQFIEVFAVDRVRDTDSGEQPIKGAKTENISVIVTPKQSRILMQYINKGTLQMALRNPDDNKEIKDGAIDDSGADELDAPAPTVAAVVEKPLVTKPVEQPVPFKTFLNTEAAAQTPVATDPVKKYWDIKIYEGETFRVEKIELPDEPGVQANSPALAPEKLDADKLDAEQPSNGKPVAASA